MNRSIGIFFLLTTIISPLQAYLVGYKKLQMVLPAECCKAGDDGKRTIHFFYDRHAEDKYAGIPLGESLKKNNEAFLAYATQCALADMPTTWVVELDPLGAENMVLCAAAIKSASMCHDLAKIKEAICSAMNAYKDTFLHHGMYSLLCQQTKNFKVVPAGKLRPAYDYGLCVRAQELIQDFSKKDAALSDLLKKFNAIFTCVSGVKRADLEYIQKNSPVARFPALGVEFEKEYKNISTIQEKIDALIEIIDKADTWQDLYAQLLPEELSVVSCAQKLRCFITLLCLLDEYVDLNILGVTGDSCVAIKHLVALCRENVDYPLKVKLFCGHFELLFQLCAALESRKECFVYAGMIHCRYIINQLETVYKASIVGKAVLNKTMPSKPSTLEECETMAELGDRYVPFDSIKIYLPEKFEVVAAGSADWSVASSSRLPTLDLSVLIEALSRDIDDIDARHFEQTYILLQEAPEYAAAHEIKDQLQAIAKKVSDIRNGIKNGKITLSSMKKQLLGLKEELSVLNTRI